MSSIATLLKDEIVRLARKEVRNETENLRKASAQYRSEIAALKKRSVALEQEIARLRKSAPQHAEVNTNPEDTGRTRFTAKGFRSLRKRLGLTAAEIGHLMDVSVPTVYNWESGNANPREKQLAKIVMLRGMGKREVDSIRQQLAA
jgi:DNA-binding transcriptional regulator YiaG